MSNMMSFVEPLLLGFVNTVKLTVLSFTLSLLFGLVLALCRLSPRKILWMPAAAFIETFRAIPALALLFWAYFALPILLGMRMTPWLALIIALTCISSAFVAETFRSGIVAIGKTQWEAARAIGMGKVTLMRRIILPQAMMRIVPMLLERFVELMKHSTIATVIAYPDILHIAEKLSLQTYRSLEIFSLTAFIFFLSLFTLSRICQRLEMKLKRHENPMGSMT